MKIYRYASGNGKTVKLIVGGLHGNEGRIIAPILDRLRHAGLKVYGEVIVIPCISHGEKYVSTLSRKYYKTKTGRILLKLIEKFRPSIYVEVHCYRRSAYEKLTDPFRRFSMGVPPLLSLDNGVLIGAALPQLFKIHMFDLGLVIEKTCRRGGEETLLNILKIVVEASEYLEIISKLSLRYPQQISRIAAYHSLIKSRIGSI
jgi:hypothetical protein